MWLAWSIPFVGLALGALTAPAFARGPAMTDDQIRERIVQESIASYPGKCPCPYNTMRNGRSCGGRSAYSRPGGGAPLCYPRDVSQSMVEAYRRSNGS